MLKVLLVYYEPRPSGQTTHVLSLIKGLDRNRYQLIVALPAQLHPSLEGLNQMDVQVVPLPMRKLLWSPSAIVQLARLIRQEAVDLVHIHSQEAGVMGRLVAWAAGARSILYTPQVVDIRQRHWHRLYRGLEWILARLTRVIVSVNQADRDRLLRWGIPASKVVTIPNGIDLAPFDNPVDPLNVRQRLGLDGSKPLVMQVGRLSEQKDPLTFVEGAAHVVQALPQTQFVLIGEGPLEAAVAARIRALGLEAQVRLAGWQAEAHRLMAAADIVSLTSRWEGMPFVLLEAMACSKPVVATAVNGCPEIVEAGLTGFLAPPNDPQIWANRVVDLLRDPKKASQMGQAGRRRVEERFTVQRMLSEIDKLYVSCSNQLSNHEDTWSEEKK